MSYAYESMALAIACAEGHYHIADYLLQQGTDINAVFKHEDKRFTTLAYVVKSGNVKALCYLCDHGVNLKQFSDGQSVLYRSVVSGNCKMTESLLELGLDVNQGGPKGYPPLSLASAAADNEIVSLLLKYGADVNRTSSNGLSCLYHALSKGNFETVRLLVNAGADPDDHISVLGTITQCPLVHCIANNNLMGTQALLKLNCNPTVTDVRIEVGEGFPRSIYKWYRDAFSLGLSKSSGAAIMLHAAGCDITSLWNDDTSPLSDSLRTLCCDWMSLPRPLKEQCKFRIRRQMGAIRFYERVGLLLLPPIMKEFIRSLDFSNCKEYDNDDDHYML